MRINLLKIVVLTLIMLDCSFSFSQEKQKDTLEAEVVNVVKPFTPKAKEVSKIKEIPKLNLEEITKSKKINYTFFSVPVASTFVPNKGKPILIQGIDEGRLYNSFATLGYGTYLTPLLNLFIQTNTSNNSKFGVYFNYISSNGEIKNVLLDSKYTNSNLSLFYKETYEDYSWKIIGSYKYKMRNWYGLPSQITFDNRVLNNIDETQYDNMFSIKGSINFNDSYFKKGFVSVNHFVDKFSSKEDRVKLSSSFEIPLNAEAVNIKIIGEYLQSRFKLDYDELNALKTQFGNIGIQPSFKILKNNLSINVGLKLYYATSNNSQKDKALIYPDIMASFRLYDSSIIPYIGLVGDVKLNSYQEFTNNNNFVSPTLVLKRTDNKYKGFVGLKGTISRLINFDAKISYSKYNDMPMFKLNGSKTDGSLTVLNGYDAGNSFNVVYDNVNVLQISGNVDADFSKYLNLGGSITFNNYSLDKEKEAWNLPKIRASIYGKYSPSKWYIKTKIYFIGERSDEFSYKMANAPIGSPQIIKNKGFVDFNFGGGYNFSNKFSIFTKFNNVLNSHYQSFSNYEVQGFQALAGITYKFDI